MYRKNVAGQFIHFQGVDVSTGGIKSGVTWTVRRSIDGTFAAATGTATEDSTNGWYKFALSQADTNGNNIGFNFTGTGAVPQTVNIITDGSPPDVNLKNAAGTAVTLDANSVLNVSTKYVGGTLQTAGDIVANEVTIAGYIDTEVAAIKAKTDQLVFTVANQLDVNVLDWKSATAPAMTGDAFARLGAPAGASVSADIAAAKVDTAAIKVQTDKLTFTVANVLDSNVLRINGDATSGANLGLATRVIGRGTASGTPTTISMPTSAFTPAGAAADQFLGRTITFDYNTTTTALRGQTAIITSSSNASTPTFGFAALTNAPVSGDTFMVT